MLLSSRTGSLHWWQDTYIVLKGERDTQNHRGWQSPVRSSSPTIIWHLLFLTDMSLKEYTDRAHLSACKTSWLPKYLFIQMVWNCLNTQKIPDSAKLFSSAGKAEAGGGGECACPPMKVLNTLLYGFRPPSQGNYSPNKQFPVQPGGNCVYTPISTDVI